MATDSTSSATGIVYLVGAGPGDPGLLTLKGAECVRRADVLVYDSLVHPALLRHAKSGAETIYAGKRSAHHAMKQEEINALLVSRASAGQIVCRLKGGDPCVFGRGGEEAEACGNAGVPFEFVPGVTSAIAAPAYAGIPVTHRDMASSFAVVTGHERDDSRESGKRQAGAAESRRDWSGIAHAADTLIFLMGVENLSTITSKLMEHGRAPDTPVALVRWGTWTKQETLVTTLTQAVEDVRRANFTAPAVVVVGEVVRLRETLRWFDTRPLFGKRVLVTRAREQASALSDMLLEAGAEPVEFPVIQIKPLDDTAAIDAALKQLNEKAFSWVVFTSVNGVKVVKERLAVLGLDSRAFEGAKLACIGPATADSLRELGLVADFTPTRFVSDSMGAEWPDVEMNGKRVLMPVPIHAREVLPGLLAEMGARVEAIPVYETVRDESSALAIREELLSGTIHAVTFTSSSTVRNLTECLDDPASLLKSCLLISIGPQTTLTLRQFGLEPSVEATESTLPGLVNALINRTMATHSPSGQATS